MSVKTQVGRRTVTREIEVPGTPEQVWQAIATGPGITCWFVPTDLEPRSGGAVTFRLEPGMESHGRVTVWEPPHRLVYEEPDWSPPAPPLATEFVVEARAGGTCVVRVVESLFCDEDDWDGQLESMEAGWGPVFEVLRLYLRHFPGQRCASVLAAATVDEPSAAAWLTLVQALGFDGAQLGERRAAPTVPALRGVVEHLAAAGAMRTMTVRLEEPAPGFAMPFAHDWGGKAHVGIRICFYGDAAAALAASLEPAWRDWLAARFPAPA